MLFSAGMVPSYLLNVKYLHLNDTIWVYILPSLISAYNLIIIRTNYKSLPNELIEAAKIDGCSNTRTFLEIILPMASSTMASLVIYTFFNTWNDYFLPLIYLSDSKLYTSTLALSLFADEVGVSWNLVMAASVISTLPLLLVFFCAQKKFIESLAMSGIK